MCLSASLITGLVADNMCLSTKSRKEAEVVQGDLHDDSTDHSIHDTSSGFHLVEYHAPSAGIGAGTLFFLVLAIAIAIMIYRKYCAKKHAPRDATPVNVSVAAQPSQSSAPAMNQQIPMIAPTSLYPTTFPLHSQGLPHVGCSPLLQWDFSGPNPSVAFNRQITLEPGRQRSPPRIFVYEDYASNNASGGPNVSRASTETQTQQQKTPPKRGKSSADGIWHEIPPAS